MDRIFGVFMLLTAAGTAGAQTLPVEVVSADQGGQTITVKQPARLNVATTSTPEDTSIVTLSVLASAATALRSVRNGQEVTITCASTGATGTTGGALPGTAAGASTGTLGGTAAGATSGTLGGTAAGNVSGTLGGNAAGRAARPRATPNTTASTAPTSTAAPTAPLPAATLTGTGTHDATVRPLSALQGSCSVASIR